jgi:hypothetical protein
LPIFLKKNKEAGDKKQTVNMHSAGRVFFLIYCTFSIIGDFSFIREKDRSIVVYFARITARLAR